MNKHWSHASVAFYNFWFIFPVCDVDKKKGTYICIENLDLLALSSTLYAGLQSAWIAVLNANET